MKLIDLVRDIETVDQEAVIFLSDCENPDSDIFFSFNEEDDTGVIEVGGTKYYYLIEAFLAKEFVVDWKASLDYEPTLEETAKRLYEYATNDA